MHLEANWFLIGDIQSKSKPLTKPILFIRIDHRVSPCAAEIWSSIVFGGPRQITMISSSEDRSVRDHVTRDHVTQDHVLQDHITQDHIAQYCIPWGHDVHDHDVQDCLAYNRLDWYRGVVHPILWLTPISK